MKCCEIHSGLLKTPISIERRTRAADGMGGYTETWTADPDQTLYCWVQNLAGTERWEAMRLHPGNLFRITLRFRGDANGAPYWTSHDRVKIYGRTYGILAIQDVEMRQIWLKMDLFEGKPS